MKDLKNNIEQTCIEFGKYLNLEMGGGDAQHTGEIEHHWHNFQKMQAKEVMDILDACDNPQEPNDKLSKAAFQSYGFNEWVAYKYNKDTIKQRLEEGFDDDLMDKDCKEFGSTQDRINHEILQLIADNNAVNDKRWKANEDVLINIAEICKSLSGQIDNANSLIKLTNNITSANEIALNHLEDNKQDEKLLNYSKLVEDYMEVYREENILQQDYLEVPASDLADFYYSFGQRIKRWVKVAIERNNKLKQQI